MSIVYLVSIILGLTIQNVARKSYSQKNVSGSAYTFNLLICLSALIFFIITSKGLSWNPSLIWYAVFFALSYGSSMLFSYYAICCGSLSLTSLVVSYSLLIPSFYGLIFLKEAASLGFIPGIVLLLVSLYFINKTKEGTKTSLKWIIYAFLAFVSNGLTSVVQKIQQTTFGGNYKNEFMILSLTIIVVIWSVPVLAKEPKKFKQSVKSGWYFALICGLANGMVNLFVMILSGIMPVSLMFPLISSGGIIVTYLVSKFFYKEKLTKAQLFGFIIGICSIIFLNI